MLCDTFFSLVNMKTGHIYIFNIYVSCSSKYGGNYALMFFIKSAYFS